jgi:uncharacterized protein
MNKLDRMGRTELHYAALHNDVSKMKQLIANGDDPNLPDKKGMTPLHFAAQQNSLDAVSLLLGLGVKVDPVDWQGNTPLWSASYYANRDSGACAKALLKAGANPRHSNGRMSPLELAQETGDKKLEEILTQNKDALA